MVTSVVEQSDSRAGETPAPQSLPPSERDFAIFRAVVVEGASTREAAEAFGLSQTRIVQIRNRVAEWIAEIGKEIPLAASLPPEQQLRLAAHIAEGRCDFLYSQAVTAWRTSQRPHTTVRSCDGTDVTTTRECFGDPRYLLAAMRLVERSARVSTALSRESVGGDRGSDNGPAEGAVASALRGVPESSSDIASPPVTTSNPPVRDCSISAETVVQISDSQPGAVATTTCQDKLSDEKRRRRRVFFGGPEGLIEDCSEPGNSQRHKSQHAETCENQPVRGQ